jgi:hypothetical protein
MLEPNKKNLAISKNKKIKPFVFFVFFCKFWWLENKQKHTFLANFENIFVAKKNPAIVYSL